MEASAGRTGSQGRLCPLCLLSCKLAITFPLLQAPAPWEDCSRAEAARLISGGPQGQARGLVDRIGATNAWGLTTVQGETGQCLGLQDIVAFLLWGLNPDRLVFLLCDLR